MIGAHGIVLGPIAPIFEQDWSRGERLWMRKQYAAVASAIVVAIGLLLSACYPDSAAAAENAVPNVAFWASS